MGTLLNIVSNHQLRFDSGLEGIKVFEKAVNQKVNDWNFKTDKALAKTSTVNQVTFSTNHEIIEYNFTRWKELRIFTNYQYCDEVKIYKNTIKFHSTGFKSKYSEWKKMLFDEYLGEEMNAYEVEVYQQQWKEMRTFVKWITRQLSGYKIIYFGDSRFQSQEEIYYEGGTIDELIDEMTKGWPPTAYNDIRKFQDNHITKYGWYIDNI